MKKKEKTFNQEVEHFCRVLEATFVAHPNGVSVVSRRMRPLLVERAAGVHIPVACNVIVVAYGGESAGLMPCDNGLQGCRGVAPGSTAMHHYQFYAPVVLVLATVQDGLAHDMHDDTPKVVATAVRIVMITWIILFHTSLSFIVFIN